MRKAQVIGFEHSYVPTDPESFYENMMITGQEDAPEKFLPIVPYEGWNFLPTVYGYKSYFDTTTQLDISSISKKVSHIFLFQLSNYTSHLIALAEDGAYFSDPQTQNSAWTKRYSAGTSTELWTYCVIANDLYLYRQGASTVAKVPFTGTIATPAVTTFTPSYLTMAGQMGIFRANGRLGFWDSANVVSWTSLFDFTDATPSISTLAANVSFNDVLGKIIIIRSFGDGFIIYTTKNIVGAEFDTQGSILFRARALADHAGIWDSRQVCTGSTDIEHYAYTNSGIKHIKAGMQVENIFPSVFDFLKESREPVFLNLINGRFLFISTPDPTYIYGKLTHVLNTVSSLTIRFLENGAAATSLPTLVEGEPLLDEIEDEVVKKKLDYGIIERWTASGVAMIVTRTPSSMQPYILDDPTTPQDDAEYTPNTTPLMTSNDIQNLRDAQNPTFVSPMDIDDSTPFSENLGWFHTSNKGETDAELTRFKNRQLQEWEEYKDLAEDLGTAINNSPPINSTETLYSGDTNYYKLSNIASHLPATPPTNRTVIGQMATAGSTAVETFSGVGQNNATWKLEKTFTDGFNVRINKQTYYSFKLYAASVVYSSISTSAYDPDDDYWHSVTPLGDYDTIRFIRPEALTAEDPFTTGDINSYTADSNLEIREMEAGTYEILDPAGLGFTTDTYLQTQLSSMFPVTLDVEEVNQGWGPLTFTFSHYFEWTMWTYVSRGKLNKVYKGVYTQNSQNPGPKTLWLWTVSIGFLVNGTRITEYEQKWLDAVNTSITPFTVKAQADQDNIEWCNYLINNPNLNFPYTNQQQTIPLAIPLSQSVLPPYASYTYPGATFLLQNGALGPAYPTLVGSFVYDTHLQKWGKQKNSFYALLDYTPVNSTVEKIISFTNLGMDGGLITPTGKVKLFGWQCVDSIIKYGKIGLNRQGYSNIDEININFREPFTGTVVIDYSIDGRNLQASLQQVETFSGEGYVTVYPDYAGRWYTISITGDFDIRSGYIAAMAAGMR